MNKFDFKDFRIFDEDRAKLTELSDSIARLHVGTPISDEHLQTILLMALDALGEALGESREDMGLCPHFSAGFVTCYLRVQLEGFSQKLAADAHKLMSAQIMELVALGAARDKSSSTCH